MDWKKFSVSHSQMLKLFILWSIFLIFRPNFWIWRGQGSNKATDASVTLLKSRVKSRGDAYIHNEIIFIRGMIISWCICICTLEVDWKLLPWECVPYLAYSCPQILALWTFRPKCSQYFQSLRASSFALPVRPRCVHYWLTVNHGWQVLRPD